MEMKIKIGFKDVYNTSVSLEDVITEIKKYNKRNLLVILVQLSSYMDLQHRMPNFDSSVVHNIFSSSSQLHQDVVSTVLLAMRKNFPLKVYAIDRRALLYLIKLVILHCPEKEGVFFDIKNKYLIGLLLLKLNDVLGENDKLPENSIFLPQHKETEERKIARVQFLMRQYYFENIRLPASFELFFRYSRILEIIQEKEDVNFDNNFINKTGSSLIEYYKYIFLIISIWNNIDPTYNALERLKINPYKLPFKFNKQIHKHFLKAESKSYQLYSSYTKKYYDDNPGSKASEFYDFTPFLYKPIVSLEKNSILCLSNTFLGFSAMENIYHILKSTTPNTKHGKIMSHWWASAFQTYCDEILKKIFNRKYLTEVEIKSKYKIEKNTPDGLIITDNFIFIIEFKSKRLPINMILSTSQQAIKEFLNDYITNQGTAQIFNTIPHLKKTGLLIKRQIIPVLITSESIPNDFYIRRYFNEKLFSLLNCYPEVLPYLLLDIRDLEMLLAINTSLDNKVIINLLVEYSKLNNLLAYPTDAIMPFINFIHKKNINVGNPILGDKIEKYLMENFAPPEK